MVYVPTDWVNGVTPLDEPRMDHIEAGILAAVEKDSVVVAASRLVASKLLVGDAQPAFQLNGDGKLQWGQGGSSVADTFLYRSSPGVVTTDGFLHAARVRTQVGTAQEINMHSDGRLWFYTDTSLYRAATNTLKTDGGFYTSYVVATTDVYAGSAANTIQLAGGTGRVNFGSPADTNLYRAAASRLKSDTQIESGTEIVARQGSAAMQVYIGQATGAAGGVVFGTAGDTNLYRVGAGVLRTDGALTVGDQIYMRSGGTPRIWFGAADDTNLYRAAAGTLQTDSKFYVNNTDFRIAGASAGITFNNDTNLYRSSGSNLKTDGTFWAAQYVVSSGNIYYGSQLDTSLARSAAGELSANGWLVLGASQGIRWLSGANNFGAIFRNSANGDMNIVAQQNVVVSSPVSFEQNINAVDAYTDNWVTRVVWGPNASYKYRMLGGVANVTTNASGQASIAYGRTVAGVIACMVSNNNPAHANTWFSAMSPGTTSFTLQAWGQNNAALANTAVSVSWIAYVV